MNNERSLAKEITEGFEALKSMRNNEPVAWMLVDETNGDYMLERHPSGDYDWIPLYTHPVKELTDEEIAKIALDTYDGTSHLVNKNMPWHHNIVLFARAILKKAQEK